MKLLFVARHFTYFRNYDAALRELAARGHELHLAVERRESLGGEAAMQALAREFPRITLGMVPERRVDTWSGVSRRLRLGLDYIRFLDPWYDASPLRRTRARERTPRLLIALADPPLLAGAPWRRFIGAVLHGLDASVPPPQPVVDYIAAQRPDAVLVTPLVDLGSQQIDYVRAARQLGVPCGLAVWSWDHLTSKARLRDYPDRVLVWNETQRREAVHDHGVPADRVVVTGAQCFDHLFVRQPSRTRRELCAERGLPDDRPLILFVCSGLAKGSPPEPPLVREWLGWVRASGDSRLAGAAVIVRPHPAHVAEWRGVDLGDLGPVALWGANPVDEQTRTDYFDSLYHSDAVVGLNTSAFIEAGIVGRPVLAILVPRYHDTQEGTPHFRYLTQIGEGLLQLGRTPQEHVAQLAASIARGRTAEHPYRAFLEAFVRPRGIERSATPDFVAAVEELARCRVAAAAPSAVAQLRRALLGRAARLASRVAGESLVRSPRELDPERLARIADAARAQQVDKA
jgi:hypothetical protein